MTDWSSPDVQNLELIWVLVAATQHLFKEYQSKYSPVSQPPVTAIVETTFTSILPTGGSKTFEGLYQVANAGHHDFQPSPPPALALALA